MRGSWRLINGVALYDVATDPGQRRDVAAEHPALVASLREAYEAWWTLCDRQADDSIPVSIRGELDAVTFPPASHDLRNDEGDGVWNQGQVRRGEACAGYWEVKVEQAGRYELALYRWPAESGHALRHGFEGADAAIRADAIAPSTSGSYVDGEALPLETARVEIAGLSLSVAIGDDHQAARLSLRLGAGETQLRAWFAGSNGLMQSPYYVEIRHID